MAEDINDKAISIVSIDMDGLKQINDTYGHAEGDLALTSLANALSVSLNSNEICARFGGDEFIAVLVSEGQDRKEEFKNAFIKKLAELSDSLNKSYRVEASIGICDLEDGSTEQVISCMQKADQAMYSEKKDKKAP